MPEQIAPGDRVMVRPTHLDPAIVYLRQRRDHLKLRQIDVARRLGTTPNIISDWECGIKIPTITVLRAWAAALGVELSMRAIDPTTRGDRSAR